MEKRTFFTLLALVGMSFFAGTPVVQASQPQPNNDEDAFGLELNGGQQPNEIPVPASFEDQIRLAIEASLHEEEKARRQEEVELAQALEQIRQFEEASNPSDSDEEMFTANSSDEEMQDSDEEINFVPFSRQYFIGNNGGQFDKYVKVQKLTDRTNLFIVKTAKQKLQSNSCVFHTRENGMALGKSRTLVDALKLTKAPKSNEFDQKHEILPNSDYLLKKTNGRYTMQIPGAHTPTYVSIFEQTNSENAIYSALTGGFGILCCDEKKRSIIDRLKIFGRELLYINTGEHWYALLIEVDPYDKTISIWLSSSANGVDENGIQEIDLNSKSYNSLITLARSLEIFLQAH